MTFYFVTEKYIVLLTKNKRLYNQPNRSINKI